jgi:predicted nucleotidyltransferase
MHPATKNPAEVAAVNFANAVVPLWQEELGPKLLGIYLMGSLAHGGFSSRYSDIDVAVVTEAGLATQTLDSVRSRATAVGRLGIKAFGILDRPTFQRGPISPIGPRGLP